MVHKNENSPGAAENILNKYHRKIAEPINSNKDETNNAANKHSNNYFNLHHPIRHHVHNHAPIPHNQYVQDETAVIDGDPNLIKRDMKQLTKVHAKIIFLEIQEHHERAKTLREQMASIEEISDAKSAVGKG